MPAGRSLEVSTALCEQGPLCWGAAWTLQQALLYIYRLPFFTQSQGSEEHGAGDGGGQLQHALLSSREREQRQDAAQNAAAGAEEAGRGLHERACLCCHHVLPCTCFCAFAGSLFGAWTYCDKCRSASGPCPRRAMRDSEALVDSPLPGILR